MESTPTRTASKKTEELANGAAADHARRSIAEARACAEELATQGSQALHKGTVHARKTLTRASKETARYVQEQPLKSLLIAAAAGAAVAVLASAIGKRRA